MAFEGHGHKVVGVEAGADLSAAQYHAVKYNATGQAVLAGVGEALNGVVQGRPNVVGEAAELVVDGETKVVYGAAVAAGAQLEVNASGRFILAATSGARIVGTAILGGGADGDIGTASLQDLGRQP